MANKSRKPSGKVAPRRKDDFEPNDPFDFRWTESDKEQDIPRRFYEALKLVGVGVDGRGAQMRALARCWTEEIERIGFDPAVRAAVLKCLGRHESQKPNYSLNEPSAKYSAKQKSSKRR